MINGVNGLYGGNVYLLHFAEAGCVNLGTQAWMDF